VVIFCVSIFCGTNLCPKVFGAYECHDVRWIQ
jgi:hypothetical protein